MTVLLLVFGVIAPPGTPKAEEPASQADLPAEVDALIFRNTSCNWSSINRGNRSSAQVEASRRYLNCDVVAEDLATLREQYRNNPRVLKALDGALLPADVDDIIQRRVGCDALTTSASKQPDRTSDSEAARRYLECDSVVKDEAALRHKYNGDPRILEALDTKWVRVIRRVPLKIAPQTDSTAPSKEQLNGIDR